MKIANLRCMLVIFTPAYSHFVLNDDPALREVAAASQGRQRRGPVPRLARGPPVPARCEQAIGRDERGQGERHCGSFVTATVTPTRKQHLHPAAAQTRIGQWCTGALGRGDGTDGGA